MNLKWFVSFCQWTYAYYSIHLLFYVYYYREIHPFDLFFAKRGVLLGNYLCFVNFILGKIHPFCLFFCQKGCTFGNYLCFFNFMLGKIHPLCLFLPKGVYFGGIIFVFSISYLEKYILFACFCLKRVYF